MRAEDLSGEAPRPTTETVPVVGDLDAAREELRRLLEQADAAAATMAVEAEQVRRANEAALSRELAEVEELRLAMIERLEAANERFGTAQRVVETSRTRLAEIDDLHAKANSALAHAVENAASMLAQVEVESEQLRERARRDAEVVIRDAQAEARSIIEAAASYQRDAERRAADTLGAAQVRVEEVIQQATDNRHAEISDLHAREQEIRERIESLLAGGVDPSALGVTPERQDEAMIDLTDGVSDAIRGVIDDWSNRRTDV